VIKTAFTELFGIDHPIALAGMAGGTSPGLAAAVSKAGGLGIHGVSDADADAIRQAADAIRKATDKPFGLNLLLHARAAEAGADVIVAQGTDGGGHIGLVGTAVIVPAVAREVDPIPVLGAGGIADGRGLAAMLAFGAAGVLVGTRFLATTESPVHDALKRAIVASDGTDTIVTDVSDVMMGGDWPGAMARVARNRLIERWLGRPNEVRRRREELVGRMREERRKGNIDEAIVYWGQSAALVDEIVPAGQVVEDMVRDAESFLREQIPAMLVD
jgi:NAD(P)H-dependent flavin oxidoreductase YrpB (nitropropane dioxygenase family)